MNFLSISIKPYDSNSQSLLQHLESLLGLNLKLRQENKDEALKYMKSEVELEQGIKVREDGLEEEEDRERGRI
jgi:hypothetical protein